MANIIEYCKLFSQLTDKAAADLLQNSTTKYYSKGDYIFQQGKICEHFYFIDEGLVKCFFFNKSIEKEFVLGFLTEDSMFSLYDSFTTQTSSNLNLIALENTTITVISYEAMENLCLQHHCIETLYRKLVTTAMTGVMKLICEMLENNTTERYNNFVEKHGKTMLRISLSDIAKLFGITPQSLSRIRASK